jgi:ELWxxDGT repeat protein
MRLHLPGMLAGVLASGYAAAQTPYLVSDINQSRPGASSLPEMVGAFGDRLFFTATRPDTGYELWTTTGTPVSTTLLEVLPGPGGPGAHPGGVAFGNALLFRRFTEFQGLWISDGTAAGTRRLSSDGVFSDIGVSGGLAFYGGGSSSETSELWHSDGTAGGTFLLKEILPGSTGSLPSDFTPLADRVVFLVDNDDPNGLLPGVWRTDGTPDGTRRVTNRPCGFLERVGSRIFMACSNGIGSSGLWTTDGTTSGTQLAWPAVLPGGLNTSFGELTAVEGTLFFWVSMPPGERLWKSDGTEAGTVQVQDGTAGPVAEGPTSLVSSGGILFFLAFTPAAGTELWRSDGTDAGTYLVRDVEPGPGSALALTFGQLTAVPGGVVFLADTTANGAELWFSDGTAAGTVPLEVEPGPASSFPNDVMVAGPRAYFAAQRTDTGRELWAVDLPPAVSVGDAWVQESDSGTATASFPVTLTGAAAAPVTVAYSTLPGSAQAGSDFQPASGVLTFAPGSIGPLTIDVPVLGDVQDEADETFTVELGAVTGALASDRRAEAIIRDEDGPSVSVVGVTVTEGNAGTAPANFSVTLATEDGGATPSAKVVSYATERGTATPGVDFEARAGALTFPPGTASGTTSIVTVPVLGDTLDEPDEVFAVRFEANGDETVIDPVATAHIRDDDGIAAAPPTEITSGSVVRATLAPPAGRVSDRDYYVMKQEPHASYEVVVDETSGDAVPLEVERVAADGSTILQTASPIGTGAGLSLRWQNTASTAVTSEHVAVASAACGTTCGSDDHYRLRVRETTLAAARYNNLDGQVTVLLLQNSSSAPISGRVLFWQSAGWLIFQQPFAVPARGALTINTAPLGVGAGSVTVTHDGPHGLVGGKAVALEPATGFSFDTPLTYRPR